MDQTQLKNSIDDYQQRVFIKFGVGLGLTAKQIHKQLVQLLGGQAYSQRTVESWVTRFRKNQFEVEERRGGDHREPTNWKQRTHDVEELLKNNKGYSVRYISQHLNLPISSVWHILNEILHFTKKLGRWIPHVLSEDQKDHRLLAVKCNLTEYNKNPNILRRTLAIDETWVSLYLPPDRNQRRFWLGSNEKPLDVVATNIHERKRMLLVALDYDGIALYRLLDQGQAMTASVYISILNEEITKWMNKTKCTRPVLLQDNARPHRAKIVTDFFEEKNIALWTHPPYSPDLNPLDYGCFGELKRMLRGNMFDSWDQLTNSLEDIFRQCEKNKKFKSIQRLPERWQAVMESEGDYI